MRNGNEFYVDIRMKEWGMGEQSRRIQSSVRRVLSALSAESLLCLKDPRLQVLISLTTIYDTWEPGTATCDFEPAQHFEGAY